MAKSTAKQSGLTASPALDNYSVKFDGIELSELSNMALISIGVPLKGTTKLNKELSANFGVKMPKTGSSTLSKDKSIRFLGLQADMLFALSERVNDYPLTDISNKLGTTGYYTDQSDSWVVLRLQGTKCRNALERICPLNLHEKAFAINGVARTNMEHLGTIILRDGKNSFVLLSPRSSAHSFLHAIETSIHNIN